MLRRLLRRLVRYGGGWLSLELPLTGLAWSLQGRVPHKLHCSILQLDTTFLILSDCPPNCLPLAPTLNLLALFFLDPASPLQTQHLASCSDSSHHSSPAGREEEEEKI
ncbi:hypothetical protein E2C01_043552 [Portunus trituberculatus]|uniref:Uncharacterized protein n=1 Tax=Portunus trituberculatus TaxID=210409 RepID=A0A5B7FPS3_PORTR|nr:hypothetical protein [Portunus trituberculatus]